MSRKVAAVDALNKRELELGIAGTSASWHDEYIRLHPVVRAGGLPYDVTDSQLLAAFEQYGAVEHLQVVRRDGRAMSAFLGYADPRSAVLAVDNLNGMKLGERQVSVDHVKDYEYPADARYNVRIEQPPAVAAARDIAVAGGGGANSAVLDAGAAERRQETVMARLRDMQKRRRLEEREERAAARAAEESDEFLPPPPEAKVERKDADRGARMGGKRQKVERSSGDKEARRLERAAIREERRRRRARRVAEGGDSGVAQG